MLGERVFRQNSEAEQKRLDAANAEARLANEAERAARRAAQEAAGEAERLRVQNERVESFRVQARASFPGSDAEFAVAWPRLLEAWRVEQTMTSLAQRRAEAARELGL